MTVFPYRKFEKQLHRFSREVVTAENEDQVSFHHLEEGHESLCCLSQSPSGSPVTPDCRLSLDVPRVVASCSPAGSACDQYGLCCRSAILLSMIELAAEIKRRCAWRWKGKGLHSRLKQRRESHAGSLRASVRFDRRVPHNICDISIDQAFVLVYLTARTQCKGMGSW